MNANDAFCGRDSDARAHSQEIANQIRDQKCHRAKDQSSLRRRADRLPEPASRKRNHRAQNGRCGHWPIATDGRIPARDQILRAPRLHRSHQTMRHDAVFRSIGQYLADREPAFLGRQDADPRAVGQCGRHALAVKQKVELPRSFPQEIRDCQQALAPQHQLARDPRWIQFHATATPDEGFQ